MKIWTLLANRLNLAFIGTAYDKKRLLSDTATKKKQQRIRCPLCGWQPDGKPYWGCEKCLTAFDTFKTHAHCPKCGNSWIYTQCIACHKLSLHEAWYENLE
jgi:predicted RNA-binding Zn-ribbon protein involved in translation (DUF1610 family)